MRFLLFIIILIFFSCHNKSTSNYFAFETLDSSLLESNERTRKSSETIMKSLEDKLYYPETKMKAGLWYPKVVRIHGLVENVYKYIDGVKTDIKKAAGLQQEEERAYLAKQLRDNINQTLTHCRLLLQAKNVDGYENAIDKKLLRGIDKAIHELNHLSIDLIPSTVQDFGFIQGTKSYIENTALDLPIEFTCKNEQIEELNLPIKFLLFRIIQGFLSILYDQKNKNAVAITVNYQNNTVTMEISIADEDFVFQNNEKAYLDIIKRVQYFGSEVEEIKLNNEKLFRIRITI